MYVVDSFLPLEWEKASIFIRDYLRAVRNSGILPGSGALAAKSFQQIYIDAKHMKENDFIGDDGCECSAFSRTAQRATLLGGLDQCWNEMGLCLAWVKNVGCEEHFTAR